MLRLLSYVRRSNRAKRCHCPNHNVGSQRIGRIGTHKDPIFGSDIKKEVDISAGKEE